MSTIFLRSATAPDQPAIRALIRRVRINPMGLDWRRFVVAEEAGQVVGAGQIKEHGDGTCELASIAVVPERQGAGIGSAIVEALITRHEARHGGDLYLYCAPRNESYYPRFGFRRLPSEEIPGAFRGMVRLSRVVGPVLTVLTHEPVSMVVMKRPNPLS
jgi:N-acetylglutamate synthase-like GNAT family acetyltransferase